MIISVERDSTGFIDCLFAWKPRRIFCLKKCTISHLVDLIIDRLFSGNLPKYSLWGLYCDNEVIAYVEFCRGLGYRCELPLGNRSLSTLHSKNIRCKVYRRVNSYKW